MASAREGAVMMRSESSITRSTGATRNVWSLDADLETAFDRVGHDHLLAALSTFPAGAWWRSG